MVLPAFTQKVIYLEISHTEMPVSTANPPCPVTAEHHREVSLRFQQASRPWPQDPEILDNGRKAAEAGPQLKGKMPVLPLHKPDLQHEADGFLNHYFGTQCTTSRSKSFHFKWPIRSSLQQRALAKKRKSLDSTLKSVLLPWTRHEPLWCCS